MPNVSQEFEQLLKKISIDSTLSADAAKSFYEAISELKNFEAALDSEKKGIGFFLRRTEPSRFR